jgi:hypothetical protein
VRDLKQGTWHSSNLATGSTAVARVDPSLVAAGWGVFRWYPNILYLIATGITFIAYAAQIINSFYFNGTYWFDSGWIAYLLSRYAFPAVNPPILGGSYFSTHLSPLLPLWGALSEGLALSPPFAFAAFQGTIHALLMLIGINIADNGLRKPWDVGFRLLFGTALAFSPIALEDIGYPHYEIAIPILFITTCYFLSRNWSRWAGLPFALMLLVREDAGFHAFCFFSAYAIGELISTRQITRSARIAIGYAGLGFFYSTIAFLIIRSVYGSGLFATNYAGPGFFDHLSS